MAELIAITFNSREEAQLARYEFAKMSREHLVELTDSVIAFKDVKGRVQLDQTVNLVGRGALQGGFLGLLVGLVLSIPLGGPLVPAVGGALGMGAGALTGKLSDYGIDDVMMRDLAKNLSAGKATLFILARNITVDKVVKHLKAFRGKVQTTSLSRDLEVKLQEALERATAA